MLKNLTSAVFFASLALYLLPSNSLRSLHESVGGVGVFVALSAAFVCFLVLVFGVFRRYDEEAKFEVHLGSATEEQIALRLNSFAQRRYVVDLISLHHCALQSVPVTVFSFTHLTRLGLHNNRLRELPKELFRSCNQLEVLVCSNNLITRISVEIQNLTRLSALCLDANPLPNECDRRAQGAIEVSSLVRRVCVTFAREEKCLRACYALLWVLTKQMDVPLRLPMELQMIIVEFVLASRFESIWS